MKRVIAFLCAAFSLFFCLWLVVADRILTPQERIDKINAISAEYGTPAYSEKDQIHVSGVARTWDGKAVSGAVSAAVHSEREYRTTDWATGLDTTIQGSHSDQVRFSGSADYGRLFLCVSVPGYAPAFSGPLTAEPGGRIEGIELVLRAGYRARVRAVDEEGQAVPGAELIMRYAFPRSAERRAVTGADGSATLNHLAAHRAILEFKADEFQTDHIDGVVFDPNGTKVVTLRKARPLTGTILAEATGQSVAGAEIRALGSLRLDDPSERHEVEGPADAVTDASGRFTLARLHQDHKYLLFVRASGYGCQYLPDVKPGDKDLTITLGTRKIIRGRVIGDLSLLPKEPGGKPFLEVTNSCDFFEFWSRTGPSTRVPVTIRDGVGTFQVEDPWGPMVYLSAGEERVYVRPQQDSLDDVVLELIRPVLRPVVLRFKAPPGAPPVTGNVHVDYTSDRDRQHRQGGNWELLAIRNGEARCEVPVPGWFSYSINNRYGRDEGPVGYWFPEARSMRIAAGQDPCLIEVPVCPAGAIYGKILGPGGSVALTARENLFLVNREILKQEPPKFLGHLFKGCSTCMMDYGEQRGTFKVTPLPLGGDYVVVAWDGNRSAASRLIHLDEKHPVIEVNLQLLQGVTVTGQLVDAEGHPVRLPVTFFGEPAASLLNDGDCAGSQADPDENGRFVFENVNPGPTGICGLSVWPRSNYQYVVLHRIKDLRSPVTIRLQKGLRLHGTVIDDATGWPVPNVLLYAFSAPEGEDQTYQQTPLRLPPEGPTNQRGEFVFSNLSPGRYEVRCFNATFTDGRQTVLVTAGQSEPVTLRITIPKWRDLKPEKPQ